MNFIQKWKTLILIITVIFVCALASYLTYQTWKYGESRTVNITIIDVGDPTALLITSILSICAIGGVFMSVAFIKHRIAISKAKTFCKITMGKWEKNNCINLPERVKQKSKQAKVSHTY